MFQFPVSNLLVHLIFTLSWSFGHMVGSHSITFSLFFRSIKLFCLILDLIFILFSMDLVKKKRKEGGLENDLEGGRGHGSSF